MHTYTENAKANSVDLSTIVAPKVVRMQKTTFIHFTYELQHTTPESTDRVLNN